MLKELREGDKVCLLKKSLYGLRQAGRRWYVKMCEALQKIGATPTRSDPCLFSVGSGASATLISVYVDDFLLASRDEKKIAEITKKLAGEFEIKDLGGASHCLGVEFSRNESQVSLCQRGFVREILKRFNMTDCKPVATPMEPGTKLVKGTPGGDCSLPYRELVGALTYLSVMTRPDIAFAVSSLGQFNNCYNEEHWKAAKRVLRYLKGTADLGINYRPTPESLRGYVDADWGGCVTDRRFYSGYLFVLSGAPISWDSRKQRTVALSTTEAEYMALSECAKEAVHLQRFLRELGFDNLAELTIRGDNKSSILLAENPTFHARTKHIDIRHHFVRDMLKGKTFSVEYVPTEGQVADFLTKGLGRTKHEWCVRSAGLVGIVAEDTPRVEGKC